MFSLLLVMAAGASSQTAVGDWRQYNNYSYDVKKVIETPDKVYYVVDNNLFHYDKKIDETYGYTHRNGLSDIVVDDIHYDSETGNFIVIYVSGNIDIIYPSGEIVNMGDIASATQIADKTVHDIAFSGDRAYVGAGFGIAVFDTKNATVIESGIFNRAVTAVTIAGDRLLIVVDGTLYFSPLEGGHNTLDRFTAIGPLNAIDMEAIAPDKVIFTNGADKSAVLTIDFNTPGFTEGRNLVTYTPYIIKSGDRWLVQNYLGSVFVDASGNATQYTGTPADLLTADHRNRFRYHSATDDGSMWFASSDGLGHYRRDADGKITVDRQPSRPMGTYLKGCPGIIALGEASGNIYLSNKAYNRQPTYNNITEHITLNILSDGFVKDITPLNADVTIGNPASQSALLAGYCMAEDPDEPGVLWVGSGQEGLYKFKDGKQVAKYDWNNMPLPLRYRYGILSLDFDSYGNLWVYGVSLLTLDTDDDVFVGVLPASKRKMANITASDWIGLPVANFGHCDTFNPVVYACRHEKSKNMVFIADGWSQNKLLVYNSAGTGETTSDDSHRVWTSFVDQDGKTFGPTRIVSMTEDRDGTLWIGTADGVITVANPASMLDGSAVIERVKVPRNDGTSYADYLLDSQPVSAIAVDGANRKWLGTSSSGVYLVSADGREIIENFTTRNSWLPSNAITSILCDPDDNTVYIGTTAGLVEYSADASPAAADYSEIYAYPNPVRPGYTGWITVTGLMDGSLVKIADAAGNVFFQGRSEGGMIVWDGCNSAGERVRTGVYYVFASSSSDSGSGAGAVTKIMVVN